MKLLDTIRQLFCGEQKVKIVEKEVFKIVETQRVPKHVRIILKGFELIGLKEISGKESNPQLLALLQKWLPEAYDDSRTAWCVIYLNEVLERSGIKPFKTLAARELLKEAPAIALKSPRDGFRTGDIVVYWREDKEKSWKGHAHFYIHDDEKYVYGLGGNQRNEVSVAPYPKSRILGVIDPTLLPVLVEG